MKIVRLSVVLLACAILPCSHAITITEDFSASGPGGGPFGRGWSVVGDSSLFTWNSELGHLEVTWDSSKPNSFFQHPLGMTLSKTNDFSLEFDLKLTSMDFHPQKPYALQLAVGFIRLAQATNAIYYRGSGTDSPNLAEFTYFWDSGFGASVTPIIISTNHQYAFSFTDYLFEFALNEQYRIEMHYTAANQTLATAVKQNGTNAFTVSFSLSPSFTDIAVDTIAISSYSDEGQDPLYAGSILAHGIIDNIVVTTPAPPISKITFQKINNTFVAQFFCQPGETYVLQRTTDFQTWTDVASAVAATNALVLEDTTGTASHAFYRVLQQQP